MRAASKHLVLALALSACATATPIPHALPPALPEPLAGAVPLDELVRGKVAIVDLWASWCVACAKTFPKLVSLEKKYSAQGLVVAGVGVGEAKETALRFAADTGLNYPLYVDPDYRFADDLSAREVPTLLLLDRNGQIIARARGIDDGLIQRLETALILP